ncbi:MAG TPA: hypothetical protein VNC50_19790 [Planctomycetia bacterium]|nr:hypothetical protein [Planctomycetia bacterium]
MLDRLLTIAFSVAITLAVVNLQAAGEKAQTPKTLDVDRLIVRKELIVSDTGSPWEKGFEKHEIARGVYAKTLSNGVAGLWVRSRLIKGEIDDPFDDRFHALERNGSRRGTPGHISWNAWQSDSWRQLAIISGEALEESEAPVAAWNGDNHPGRLRFQSFRPGHGEPLTDAVIGQGMMSVGGGGFGGGGLPYPKDVLQLWGGQLSQHPVPAPEAPVVVKDDGSGLHDYSIIAFGPQGRRSPPSPSVRARGLATLSFSGPPGGDSFIILRDGNRRAGPLRIEGSQKPWTDRPD